MVQFMSD